MYSEYEAIRMYVIVYMQIEIKGACSEEAYSCIVSTYFCTQTRGACQLLLTLASSVAGKGKGCYYYYCTATFRPALETFFCMNGQMRDVDLLICHKNTLISVGR